MPIGNIRNNQISMTIKEQVYTIIKDDILNGIIKPGTWLQENELASKLNVSRSPVREALKELTGEGLLENIPNKGVFVRELTEKDIIDVFEMRIIIEKYSIEKLVDLITEEDMNELDEIFSRLQAAFDNEDVNLYSFIDAELHNAIIYLSGNKLIYDVNNRVFSLLQPFRTISLNSRQRFEESIDEHRNIIKAIKEKDSETAWRWDLTHLNLAKDEILKYISSK